MIHNDWITLLLDCYDDIESHRLGGDTVPFNVRRIVHLKNIHIFFARL